ncbi:dTDP-glucose 4,6-dehydratase [Catellatospora sp. TT07R-123]|uniref:dTDP-glucose 4,6-dehydratase n=1 Tax=Catellatospora sp. TT07R-123 TaxID=2733863 RepID=UPI001B0FE918|nr:dTDP-glucose 4,6-dehydratase [Catellatospora sp. TT07R-123]GHJ44570.1 dTDP-glucose 4,6-dehydratase [Catellatospora sp. TT07R-123]
MKILVTGGAGFIGSQYVRSLLGGEHSGHGDSVTVLDKLTYCGNPANLAPVADSPHLTFVTGDICDADLVDQLVPGHDAVVHLAAETHVDRSVRTAAGFVRTNVLGTQVLLDAALRHGVGRFVHVSTDEVYGSIEHGRWREDQPLAPRSPYSAAKAGSDLLALAYHATHGLDVVVTRCANNYGPYQFPEKIIPLFTTNLLDGLPVPLYGDGTQVREWLHVADHCAAIDLVLRRGRPGAVYHVGGTAELTNRELAGLLLAATGRDADLVRTVADRKGHDRRYALDDTRIREELGYAPRVGFATGLAATVAWYRDNRAWWQPLKGAAALPEPA